MSQQVGPGLIRTRHRLLAEGRTLCRCRSFRLACVAEPSSPKDGVTPPEGARVTVIADDDRQPFETTAEEESELLEAIAGVERGEIVRAEDLLERLRR